MVVAVIADTHLPRGRRRLPDACVDRLCASDLIVHAGDFSGLAFFDELAALGPPLEAVYGNADEPALRERLPRERVLELPGARLGLVHVPGSAPGREARLAEHFPGCDAVVYGHTHRPQIDRVSGCWILNPGSPTERRRAPERSMLMLAITPGGMIVPELITFV
jgi:putative phosphoesterase